MRFQPNALLLAAGLALAGAAAPTTAHAQVGVNTQLGHPTWGPAAPAGAQYYYVPEIDGYYDLQAQNYIVQRNGRWARLNSVPGYNTANFHPVAVNYRGREPWAQYRDHHARYYRPAPPRPGPGRPGPGGPGRPGPGGPGGPGPGRRGPGPGPGYDDHGRH